MGTCAPGSRAHAALHGSRSHDYTWVRNIETRAFVLTSRQRMSRDSLGCAVLAGEVKEDSSCKLSNCDDELHCSEAQTRVTD